MDNNRDEDAEGFQHNGNLEDGIARITAEFLKRSNLHPSDSNQKTLSNKRKAPYHDLDDGPVRKQRRDDDDHASSDSTVHSGRSLRLSGRRRAFGEHDIQEFEQAIVMQVTNYMSKRLRELDHSRTLPSASTQSSHHPSVNERTSRPNSSSNFDAVSFKFEEPPLDDHLSRQVRATPNRPSLWALPRPLTPAAEVRRGYVLSSSHHEQMRSHNSGNYGELLIDPNLIREDEQATDQNQQQHEIVDCDLLDESSFPTNRAALASSTSIDIHAAVKDESDLYPNPDEGRPKTTYEQLHNSVESPAAETGTEYSANTKRRLEQWEPIDTLSWRWTEEQDSLLLRLKNVENLEWPEVSKHFPSRSYRTIQQRYYNLMKPARKDSQLREQLERQKALNRKLMRENAALRGVPYEEPADENPEHGDQIHDGLSFHRPINENAVDDRNDVDSSVPDDTSSQILGPEMGANDTELQKRREHEPEPYNTIYPDPEDAYIDPLLFSQRLGHSLGDQTVSHMVGEDESSDDSLMEISMPTGASGEKESRGSQNLSLNNGLPTGVSHEEDEAPTRMLNSNGMYRENAPKDFVGLNLPPSNTERFKKWRADEDRRLLELRYFERRKWPDLASHFPGRTYRSLQQRYYSFDKPELYLDRDGVWKIRIKGSIEKDIDQRPWTEEEDQLVLHLRDVERVRWKEIVNRLPNRCGLSIRKRYFNLTEIDLVDSEQGQSNAHIGSSNSVQEATKALGWSIIELEQLRHLKDVQHLGWEKIAEKLPGRSIKNIRLCYCLMRDKSKGGEGENELSENHTERPSTRPRNWVPISQQRPWHSDEEWILYQMRDVEKKSWDEICERFHYRTRGAIQLRYYTVAREVGERLKEENLPDEDQRVAFERLLQESRPNTRATEGNVERPIELDEVRVRTPQKHEKPPTEPELVLDEPWKPSPITPSTLNPRTNQPWKLPAMKDPLFPPKHNTDELLRTLAAKQSPVTPKSTSNQSRQSVMTTESPDESLLMARPSLAQIEGESVTRQLSATIQPILDHEEHANVTRQSSMATSSSPDQAEDASSTSQSSVTAQSALDQVEDRNATRQLSVTVQSVPDQEEHANATRQSSMTSQPFPDQAEDASSTRHTSVTAQPVPDQVETESATKHSSMMAQPIPDQALDECLIGKSLLDPNLERRPKRGLSEQLERAAKLPEARETRSPSVVRTYLPKPRFTRRLEEPRLPRSNLRRRRIDEILYESGSEDELAA